MSISCFLGDVLAGAGISTDAFADLAPFDVAVLHPGRTLIEKLTIVHAEARRLEIDPDASPEARLGRHFYDIHELLGDGRVLQLVSDGQERARMLDEIDEVISRHFHSASAEGIELCPSGGFSESPAFTSGSDVSRQLCLAYESTMPELYFGSSPLASLGSICERVRESAAVL